MSGFGMIFYSIIGTFLAFVIIALVAWFWGKDYITNDVNAISIIEKLTEIIELPDTVLEKYTDEIENIVSLLDILKNPETSKFISDIRAGLEPTLNMEPYIGNAMTDIAAAISNEISSITAGLESDIRTRVRAEANRLAQGFSSIL